MKKSHYSFTILAVGLLSLPAVVGQSSAQQKKTKVQASSSPAVKTRARRMANATAATNQNPAASSAPSSSVSDEKPETTDDAAAQSAPARTAEPAGVAPSKPSQGQVVDTPAASGTATSSRPADPVLELREQIDAATNSQERVPLQLKLVDLLITSGKRSDALAELNRIVSSDEFNPQGLYNTGNSFARIGETEAAIGAYRKAIDQKNGQYSRALNNLGVLLLRAGRWDEAYEALFSALKLESFHYAEASYNLGRLYAARGDNDLAIREWRRALKTDPHHTAAAEAIAGINTEGSVTVATPPAVKTAKVSPPKSLLPPKSNVRPIPATSSSERKKPTTPVSAATTPKVLAIDQTSYEFLQRARNSSEQGKVQDAIDNYHRLISRQGGYFPPANLELSYLLVSLKKYDEAQANLLQVSTRDGNRYPVSYFHLARLYELKGDLPNAEASFARAANAFGNRNLQFLLDLSRVREKQGNFKGALEAMEQYVTSMKIQGQELSWSDERLSALRQKLSASTPK